MARTKRLDPETGVIVEDATLNAVQSFDGDPSTVQGVVGEVSGDADRVEIVGRDGDRALLKAGNTKLVMSKAFLKTLLASL